MGAPPRRRPLLPDALEPAHAGHRISLAQGLLRHDIPGGFEMLRAIIEDGKDFIARLRAIQTLAYGHGPGVIELLVTLIEAEDELSEEAASALASIPDPEARSRVLAVFRTSGSFNVMNTALVPALLGDTREDVVQRALDALKDTKRPWARWSGLKLLAALPRIPPACLPALRSLLPEVKRIQEHAQHAHGSQLTLARALRAAGDEAGARVLLSEVFTGKVTGEVSLHHTLQAAHGLAKYFGDAEALAALHRAAEINPTLPDGGEVGRLSDARFIALHSLFDLNDPEGVKQVNAFIARGEARRETHDFLRAVVRQNDAEALAAIARGHDSVYTGNTELRAAYHRAYRDLVRNR